MSLSINPVLNRELRERMRSGRAFVVLGVFLGLLVLTLWLVFQGNAATAEFDIAAQTRVGRLLFESVLLMMTLLVLFFVPGITAASLAGERERQTLQPMQVTLLRPRQLLTGKIMAAMSFLLLLIIAALPVMNIAYLLGGIRVIDGIRGLGIVSLLALLFTTIVASLSARARRVQSATLMAYGATLLLVVAGPLLWGIAATIDRSRGDDPVHPPAVLLTVNPITVLADATAGATNRTDAPLSAIAQQLTNEWRSSGHTWFGWFPDERNVREGGQPFPAWLLGSAGLAIIAALMAWRGVRALRTPAETER